MIRLKTPSFTLSAGWLIPLAGVLAVGGGLIFWGLRLHALRAPVAPAAPSVPAPVRTADPDGERVAAWLGPGEVRLNVAVLGLVRRNDQAIALLSVNDGPPKPYKVGEPLMREVTLQAIEADGVTVSHAGKPVRLAAPPRPDPLPGGIVRVP